MARTAPATVVDVSFADEFTPTPGGRLVAHIWDCGDDCRCTRAKLTEYQRLPAGGWCASSSPWLGTFTTDGEGYELARRELNRLGAMLRKSHHDLYTQIVWPWSDSPALP